MRNRRGQFKVSAVLIDDMPEQVAKLFEGMVVTRCEYLWDQNCFTYIAIGPMFEEVQDGMTAPIYDVEAFTVGSETPSLTFKRK